MNTVPTMKAIVQDFTNNAKFFKTYYDSHIPHKLVFLVSEYLGLFFKGGKSLGEARGSAANVWGMILTKFTLNPIEFTSG